MSSDLKSHIRERIEQSREFFLNDLEAMPEEMLRAKPGGAARTGFDVAYECALINERVAHRLRREDPPTLPKGFIRAPEDFDSKDKAMTRIKESSDTVLKAWDQLSADELNDKIPLAQGETTPLEMANICASHMMYHDAQLNYIQTLHGDTETHWKF